jgi:hypothetical protein
MTSNEMKPDLDRIYISPYGGEIWQGNADSALRLHPSFDLLVLCAEEFQPDPRTFAAGSTAILYAPNDDAKPTPDQLRIAHAAADQVARTVMLGRRSLVTCLAGRNRSGLVSALALHMLTGCGGRTAKNVVRKNRLGAAALTNRDFNSVLDRIPPRSR